MLLFADKVDANVQWGPNKLSMFHDIHSMKPLKFLMRYVRHHITDIKNIGIGLMHCFARKQSMQRSNNLLVLKMSRKWLIEM